MNRSINNLIRITRDYTPSLQDLAMVAYGHHFVDVAEEVYSAITHSRQVILQSIESDKPVYGLSTGVGSLKKVKLSAKELTSFNEAVILDHAAGVGDEVPQGVVRAAIFARITALSKVGSGISRETFEGLLRLLNSEVVPIVYTTGSVGEADLVQLAHIASVLIGEGEAAFRGERMSGREALDRAGLSPVLLQPRDALSLIGTNSFSTATAGLSIWAITQLNEWAEWAAALSWAAFLANRDALRPDVLQRHSSKTAEVASRLLDKLKGTDYRSSSIQDPLSFRCFPHVHGSLLKAMNRTEACLIAQMARALDNPLCVTDSEEIISNGNFNATELAIQLDSLRNSLFRVVLLQERRIGKLLTSHHSGLPTGLSDKAGYSGIDILTHTALSLTGEAVKLAQMTYPQFGEAAEGIEDYGSMAAQSANDLVQLIKIWREMTSIELLIAFRASKWRDDLQLGQSLRQISELIETAVEAKRTPAAQISAVARLLPTAGGELSGVHLK